MMMTSTFLAMSTGAIVAITIGALLPIFIILIAKKNKSAKKSGG